MKEQILNELLKFEENEWINYIQGLCYELDPSPSINSISFELNEQLFWIFNNLNKVNKQKRLIFTKSLILFLRTVEPDASNEIFLHTLILFIHECPPIENRNLIELLIKDEKFTDLNYGKTNLHFFLIKAYTFIEDTQKLFLEEYLLSSRFKYSPSYLFLIFNYYVTTGHVKKALTFFGTYMVDDGESLNPAFCEELYYSLTNFVPNYVDIYIFLDYLFSNKIKFSKTNNNLQKVLNKFITGLTSEFRNDPNIFYFVEDFLKDNLSNYKKGLYNQSTFINREKLAFLCADFITDQILNMDKLDENIEYNLNDLADNIVSMSTEENNEVIRNMDNEMKFLRKTA